jgi:hypothetical protein
MRFFMPRTEPAGISLAIDETVLTGKLNVSTALSLSEFLEPEDRSRALQVEVKVGFGFELKHSSIDCSAKAYISTVSSVCKEHAAGRTTQFAAILAGSRQRRLAVSISV